MSNSFDMLEASRNKESIKSAVDGWLDDEGNPDEYNRTYIHKRGENIVMIAVEYTEE